MLCTLVLFSQHCLSCSDLYNVAGFVVIQQIEDGTNFVAYVQSILGFALGSIPSQAPNVPWSTTTQHGTTCICSWTSQARSPPPPITTASSHSYALTGVGEGVATYVMIAMDWADMMDVLGVASNMPSETEAPFSQIISIHRWDAGSLLPFQATLFSDMLKSPLCTDQPMCAMPASPSGARSIALGTGAGAPCQACSQSYQNSSKDHLHSPLGCVWKQDPQYSCGS